MNELDPVRNTKIKLLPPRTSKADPEGIIIRLSKPHEQIMAIPSSAYDRSARRFVLYIEEPGPDVLVQIRVCRMDPSDAQVANREPALTDSESISLEIFSSTEFLSSHRRVSGRDVIRCNSDPMTYPWRHSSWNFVLLWWNLRFSPSTKKISDLTWRELMSAQTLKCERIPLRYIVHVFSVGLNSPIGRL